MPPLHCKSWPYCVAKIKNVAIVATFYVDIVLRLLQHTPIGNHMGVFMLHDESDEYFGPATEAEIDEREAEIAKCERWELLGAAFLEKLAKRLGVDVSPDDWSCIREALNEATYTQRKDAADFIEEYAPYTPDEAPVTLSIRSLSNAISDWRK